MVSSPDRVTIKQAISRGMWMVNYPVMAIIFTPWLMTGLLTWLAANTKYNSTFFDWVFLPLAGLSLACMPLAWLWWSIQTPKWKLWAYSRVENIDDLKAVAIKADLIWPDNHIFEKTEICAKATRAQILKLEGRLK